MNNDDFFGSDPVERPYRRSRSNMRTADLARGELPLDVAMNLGYIGTTSEARSLAISMRPKPPTEEQIRFEVY